MNGTSTVTTPARGLRGILAYCLERDTLIHSARTALLVGTILALINHGADMLAGQLSARWVVPMLITYLVPFSVATYGQVHGKRQRDALKERADPPAIGRSARDRLDYPISGTSPPGGVSRRKSRSQ